MKRINKFENSTKKQLFKHFQPFMNCAIVRLLFVFLQALIRIVECTFLTSLIPTFSLFCRLVSMTVFNMWFSVILCRLFSNQFSAHRISVVHKSQQYSEIGPSKLRLPQHCAKTVSNWRAPIQYTKRKIIRFVFYLSFFLVHMLPYLKKAKVLLLKLGNFNASGYSNQLALLREGAVSNIASCLIHIL